MALSYFSDTWFGLYAGRDFYRPRGWVLQVGFIPRRELTFEGEVVLCGLRVTLRSRPPRLTVESDAREIAARIHLIALTKGAPVMASDIAYARVNGPPRDWRRVAVFDAETGGRIERVIEANAAEGWFVRHAVGLDGKVLRDGPDRVIERVERPVLIKRVHGCGAPIRPHPNWKPEPTAPPRPGPAPAPRTPEHGQAVHTPEQGLPFPTRRQPK